MNAITLNNELTISFSDSFHIMDAAERKNLSFIEEGKCECLQDREHHILISIGWKTPGALVSLLVGSKDAAKNMESSIQKAMMPFGFSAKGHEQRAIGQEQAQGFSYEYEAQGIRMYGESYAVKHNKTFYYINFYCRRESGEESLGIWNDILGTTKWL